LALHKYIIVSVNLIIILFRMTRAHSNGQKHVHQPEVDLAGVHANAIYNGDLRRAEEVSFYDISH